MLVFEDDLRASLDRAHLYGTRPVWFFLFRPRSFETGETVDFAFWTGDYVLPWALPDAFGVLTERQHIGRCGISHDGITMPLGLVDKGVDISMSQIAPAAQALFRGYDLHGAYAEIHFANRVGGTLTSAKTAHIGIVDKVNIQTPAIGGVGSVSISVRDELITQLSQINPALSSNAHMQRRSEGDLFNKFASNVSQRELEFYEK